VDLAVAILLVGVVGAYFAGVLGNTDPVKLLAVGFSADSMVDVILPKFETSMKKRASEIVAK
jgi:hypothetical protein